MLSVRLVGVVDDDVVDRFLLCGDAETLLVFIKVAAAAEDGVVGAALRAEEGRPCDTSLRLRDCDVLRPGLALGES